MRQHTTILVPAVLVSAAALLAACSSSPSGGGEGRTPPPASRTPPGTASGEPGTPRTVADGLKVPWAVAFLPGGDALVTERDTARLLRVTPSGRRTTVGTVPGVDAQGEGGLLGVAVSPSYDTDQFVYLYYTAASDNRVVRATYDGRLRDLRPIVTGIPKGGIHNGGRLAFGPDEMLYIATGETGEGDKAQDRNSLGGKILRVTPDGAPAPGNPFGTRVWTYGHRNVQGLAWDAAGRMYATEFGQDHFDEINLITKGRNYGWPVVEGVGHRKGFTDPLLTWTTDQASPSGLAYADGSLWAAALRGERLWQIPLDDGGAGRPIARLQGRYGRLRAVVRAPDGSLWVTTSNQDGRGTPRSGDDRILDFPLG
ncbi:PQQ-dependent sugar dehydrogenase [Actinomadura mexicana]|uniref:Glucose/arabinose dehydrogenase, beta-propeller fold n=1 Tax=Actinomadura mexicana TaxID=134959 RepID=A0A238Z3L0_9ACTN|nr:PQQ-dependent sugar dehydrogenase [Actinomadura mexicana]SNR77444.1 Glucose/arabinose dehydrogenase, beta-propeller fold [Actinomadura mexicana]